MNRKLIREEARLAQIQEDNKRRRRIVGTAPGTEFSYHPALLGFYRLKTPVWTALGRQLQTVTWGLAASESTALKNVERWLENQGALQPPPQVGP